MVGALPTFHCLLGSACLVAGEMVGCDAVGCHASLVDLVLRSGLRKVVLIRPRLRMGLAAHSPHRSVEPGANSPHRVRTAIRSKRPRIGSRIGHFAAQILGLLVAASPCWVIFRKPWPVSVSSLLRALSFSFAVGWSVSNIAVAAAT